MTHSAEDVKKMLENFEDQIMDRKSYRILSHADDLAELMVAFGSNKHTSFDFGGKIIIGVDNDNNIEEFTPKQGHEEHIMNVARDKCSPSIYLQFEKVDIDNSSVYVVTIPKMKNQPFQIITPEGKSHRIRVGSTVREPTPEELAALYSNSSTGSNEEKISHIESSLPKILDGPQRRMTIIPIEVNSALIEFDKENTMYFKSIMPLYPLPRSISLVQNEMHYESRYDSRILSYGVLNDMGYFSLIERIPPEQTSVVDEHQQLPRLVSIEGETTIILSMLDYVIKVYQKIGYQGRILIRYFHHNVENYNFNTNNFMTPSHGFQHLLKKSDFTINREVLSQSLNIKQLTNSILEEIARTSDWPVEQGHFSSYVDNAYQQMGL